MADFIFDDAVLDTPPPAPVSYLDSLRTARDNSAATLAQITVAPKPSYAVHGHNFSWTEYQRFLIEHIESCNRLLAQGEPFEIVGAGV
jgi:hypothetical protein